MQLAIKSWCVVFARSDTDMYFHCAAQSFIVFCASAGDAKSPKAITAAIALRIDTSIAGWGIVCLMFARNNEPGRVPLLQIASDDSTFCDRVNHARRDGAVFVAS